MKISTSVLTVELDDAKKVFTELKDAKTDFIHIDVMDGEFVEKNTAEKMFKYALLAKEEFDLKIDVHLMVSDPCKYVKKYLELKPEYLTVHYESFDSNKDIIDILEKIKSNGIKTGISIKPMTQTDKIIDLLKYLDLVLIMTVEPGKGGQKLIPETLEKAKKLKEIIRNNNSNIQIEVDGGVNLETIKMVKKADVDISVAGTAIINSENFEETINKLKE